MQVQIGNYRHRINEAGIAVSHRVSETKAGVPYMVDVEWTIEGKLRNPSGNSRDLDNRLRQLEQAYSGTRSDIALLHNDGRKTHHGIKNSDTLGGVRTSFLAYPSTRGAEYCTYRSYQVAVKASIPLRGNGVMYIDFAETISISGGGRRWGVKEVNEGLGTRQQIRTNSRCQASQSGSATMLGRYPVPPPPIWPFALEDELPKFDRLPPVVQGSMAQGNLAVREMTIQWSWTFVSPVRLDGVPHFALR